MSTCTNIRGTFIVILSASLLLAHDALALGLLERIGVAIDMLRANPIAFS
jgi:hypothetical protein